MRGQGHRTSDGVGRGLELWGGPGREARNWELGGGLEQPDRTQGMPAIHKKGHQRGFWSRARGLE